MAKKMKRFLAILIVLSFCMAQLVSPAFAANNNQNSSKYEWYQVYVNGALVKADQGPAGNDGWLVRGVYSWNVSISGTTMSWKAGAHSGTVNLKNYITIPDGYEVAENGYTVEHKSVEGVNSQADRFDNAIITVTIKALYNEQTGETIPVTEPTETEPTETEPTETEPVETEPVETEPSEPEPSEPEPTDPPAPVDFEPKLSITKAADKAVYKIGETITWTITVTNISEYTAYNVAVSDPLTGDSWNIAALAPGATQTFTATAVAAEAGTIKNVVAVNWTDNDEIPDDKEPEEPKGGSDEEIVEVREPVDYEPVLKIAKTSDKAVYEIGETIIWTITVTNISQYTAYNVAISDALTGDSWNLASLAPGATQTFTATTVAAEPGTIQNVVVASWTDNDEIPDNKEPEEPKSTSDKETVEVNEPAPVDFEPKLSVTKTADKATYEIGETIIWTITVTNISEYTAYDVTVSDALTGDSWNLAALAPGATQTFTATTVAAEPGTIQNVVAVNWTDNDEIPDDKEPEEPKTTSDKEIVEVNEPEPTEPEPTEPPVPVNHAPVVEIVKTADKAVYEIGETIVWTITVTNTSEYTAYNVAVSDALTGDSWNIDELAPGAVCVYTATSLAEAAGTVKNVVVTSWTDNDEIPDDKEPEEPKTSTDEKIVEVNEPEPIDLDAELKVTKVADKATYKVGEVVTWTITVSNVGACTAYDVVVTDEMTGDSWTINELTPGAVRIFTVTAVAEEAGTLRNVVVTTWTDNDEIPDDKEPEEPKITTDEEIVEIREPVDYEPVLRISKVADKRNYRVGETITWYILIQNISEYTAYNVTVVDEMTGDSWTIDELAPDARESFTATSIAQAAGRAHNVAVVTWEDNDEIPDKEEIDEITRAEDEDSVNVVNPTPNPDPKPDPDPDPDPKPDPNPDPDPKPLDDDFPVGGEVEIPDEEVPLADVPKTGDISLLWAAASILSAGGLMVVSRKREEEE